MFVIVDQVVLSRKEGEHDALSGQYAARDDVSLCVRTDVDLHHHVHNAEGQQDREGDQAVGLPVLEGGLNQHDKTDNRTDAEENRIARNETESAQLRRQTGGRVRQLLLLIAGRRCPEQGAVIVHDAHGAANKTGDDAAPAPCIRIGHRLEGVALVKANKQR